MNENAYRLGKLIVMAIAVAAGILIAWRWAENGRFVQYDKRATYSPDGKECMVSPAYMAFDTRTGELSIPAR